MPGAATLLDGGLAQNVLGVTAFANWDIGLYTEAGLYWTPSHNFLRTFGADASGSAGIINGAAPYFRIAYEKDYGTQNFEIGAFALIANLYPGGDMSAGTTDRFSDVGIDGSYQFMGDGSDIYTVDARYTHEHQRLAASQILLTAANVTNTLDDFRAFASYYRDNTFGGTIGFFDTWGSADALLYGRDVLPDMPSFMRRVCSGYAPGRGVLQTPSV